jgi:hypothetical protein
MGGARIGKGKGVRQVTPEYVGTGGFLPYQQVRPPGLVWNGAKISFEKPEPLQHAP